ncbi:hypothetical protein ABZ329_26275 [Streptomyces rubiginosohelvolus]|uniref:hypothetical protein n=1 Tax=Streptomyces TaxID=1883 RepID=UPI00117C0A9B|nr:MULTISPECIES: hypothetical protein [unclassified Streptomyces]MZG02129.1 hypothetical protein [Streptomyces sp. SID5614]
MSVLSREFVTPSSQEFVNALGVEPECVEGTVQVLRLGEVTGEEVTFAYDAVGRSVRVTWFSSSGDTVMDIYREGGELLRITEDGNSTGILAEFSTGGSKGEIRLQVFPAIQLTEESLIS